MRNRLFAALTEYSTRVGVEGPEDAANSLDMVRHVEDVLRHTASSHAFRSSGRQSSGQDFLTGRQSSGAWASPQKSSAASRHQQQYESDSAHKRRARPLSDQDFLDHDFQRGDSVNHGSRGFRATGSSSSGDKRAASPANVKKGQRGSPPTSRSPPEADTRQSRSGRAGGETRLRSNSESSPLHRSRGGGGSSSNPLQERLRRAQLAFAALRE